MSKIFERTDKTTARMKNPIVLAYIGDTVYDLYYRTDAVKKSGANVNVLNKAVRERVNAHAQSLAVAKIEELFTEEERDIFTRGRNAKSHTTPKNMSVADYRRATGLEAVMGYLFLIGEYERLDELMNTIMDETGE